MNRTSSRTVAAVLALVTVLLPQTACQYALELWVEPGSRRDRLVLRIGEGRTSGSKVAVDEICVFRCSDIRNRGADGYYPQPEEAVWTATSVRRESPLPTDRIEYGKDSAALETVVGPIELEYPACYVVRAYARDANGDARIATVGFTLTEDGTAYEMSKAAYDTLFAGQRSSRGGNGRVSSATEGS
jgi:hypothetical protein